VAYDVDGGLFRRRGNGCQPGTNAGKPPQVPFPIDEGEEAPVCGPEGCPEIPFEPPVVQTCPPIDIDAIVEEVIRRLPPVKMEIEHADGKVFSQSKPLGEAIRLRLVPQQ
jgi:hypothetical protein